MHFSCHKEIYRAEKRLETRAYMFRILAFVAADVRSTWWIGWHQPEWRRCLSGQTLTNNYFAVFHGRHKRLLQIMIFVLKFQSSYLCLRTQKMAMQSPIYTCIYVCRDTLTCSSFSALALSAIASVGTRTGIGPEPGGYRRYAGAFDAYVCRDRQATVLNDRKKEIGMDVPL